MFEILYWSREDRTFTESPFFRNRICPEDATSELCRERLLSRNTSCYKTCDRCNFQCTNALARTIADTWKCSAGLPTQGIFAAARISDVGVDIHHRHGSNRITGKPSIPEVAWPEIHHTLIGNDVTYPKVPRDSISCRKLHPESNYGHYVPPLDSRGIPRKREGFHVRCLARTITHVVVGARFVDSCRRQRHNFMFVGQLPHRLAMSFSVRRASDSR